MLKYFWHFLPISIHAYTRMCTTANKLKLHNTQIAFIYYAHVAQKLVRQIKYNLSQLQYFPISILHYDFKELILFLYHSEILWHPQNRIHPFFSSTSFCFSYFIHFFVSRFGENFLIQFFDCICFRFYGQTQQQIYQIYQIYQIF